MKLWRSLVAVSSLILLTGTAQCGATSDAPPAQVLLWVDTDAPSASLALSGDSDAGASTALRQDPHLTDSAVDTLRIDMLNADNATVDWREIPAPDEANWPISFGVPADSGARVARIRLRAFRAQRAQLGADPETGTQVFEPVPAYTIDRIVEIPLPAEKGAYAYRVVLRSQCRGDHPDFVAANTCVDAGRKEGGYRDGIEFVAPGTVPTREPLWWPGDPQKDCANVTCPNGSLCMPGGFFMLGNTRVVGFRALSRHDAVPPHPVAMKPFCIDRTEMTIAGWNSANIAPPMYDPTADPNCTWTTGMGPAIDPAGTLSVDTPINCVTWDDAQAACQALGGRLPTEAEWEFVATGRGRGFLFPWGDAPPHCTTSSLARYDQFGLPQCPVESGSPTGIETPGAHPHDDAEAGVMDMAGSLSEWMLDTFLDYDKNPTEGTTPCWRRDGLLEHPACLSVGDTKSVRGGSFASPMEVSYAALRNSELQRGGPSHIGFRCVYPIGDDPIVLPSSSGNPDPPDPPPQPDGGQP